MKYTIPYGKTHVELDAPEKSVIFTGEMTNLPALSNLEYSIIDALDNPIGTPPFKTLASGKSNIVFLVEDNTRETPLAEMLPVIVNYLNKNGVKDESISFMTAPGTHRSMTDDELREKLGPRILQRFNVRQHNATVSSDIFDLGCIEVEGYSVPVHVNRYALEADLLVGLGNIVPHCNAGYSGGAKIVLPGISDFASTSAAHAAAVFCSDIPLGVINGNLCRHAIEEAAKIVGLDFILNVVMNCKGKPAGIFTGDFVKAHRTGSLVSEKSFQTIIPTTADIVVVSSYPADIDFWQAGKGLACAYYAVKTGGVIILAAPCYEGLANNHDRYREYLNMTLQEISALVKSTSPGDLEADIVAASVAAENRRIRDKARIFVVSEGLTSKDVNDLGFKQFKSVQSALNEALTIIPSAKIGILPKGGISLPVIK